MSTVYGAAVAAAYTRALLESIPAPKLSPNSYSSFLTNSSQINKYELLNILEKIIIPQFNRLLFQLNVPVNLMPPSDKPQTERAIALLYSLQAIAIFGVEAFQQRLKFLLTSSSPVHHGIS